MIKFSVINIREHTIIMKFFGELRFWMSCPHFLSSKIQRVHWNCGKKETFGVNEVYERQNWSERETTPDQKRIEGFLSSQNVGGKSLLHVGIGNSGFAKIFHSPAEVIDGITIEPQEFKKGKDLGINNYRVFLLNKYSAELPVVLGKKYDFIIDNNPSTFACCRKHFYTMMKSYFKMLRPGGVILTDKLGLSWYSSLNNPIWGLSVEDWFEIGSEFNFEGVRYDDWIFGLKSLAAPGKE